MNDPLIKCKQCGGNPFTCGHIGSNQAKPETHPLRDLAKIRADSQSTDLSKLNAYEKQLLSALITRTKEVTKELRHDYAAQLQKQKDPKLIEWANNYIEKLGLDLAAFESIEVKILSNNKDF